MIRALLARCAAVGFVVLAMAALPRVSPAAPIVDEPPLPAAPANPATEPTTGPTRDISNVLHDLGENGARLAALEPNMDRAIYDPARRAALAPKAIPILRKMCDLLDEGMAIEPRARGRLAKARLETAGLMVQLGDAGAATWLHKQTVSEDRSIAISALAREILVDFTRADLKPAPQTEAIDRLAALARAHPDSDQVAEVAYAMCEHAAGPKEADAAFHILTDDLSHSALAPRVARQVAAERRRSEILGKPFVLAGQGLDGKPFSTAQWKGKVVLVDFWATWCVDCIEEMPRVFKVYKQYHEKGLEVVGVSSDTDANDLRQFIAANPGVAWPQLFDPQAAQHAALNPLAAENGVDGLPMMFLIDKKGVLRSTGARTDMETLIPKLLAEKGE